MPVIVHQLLVDWSGNGTWAETHEDVTDDLYGSPLPILSCERGKDQASIFAPPMAGSLATELINEDGKYNPYVRYLLLEDGTRLLLEDGEPLQLEGSDLADAGLLEPGKAVRYLVNNVPLWTGVLDGIPHDKWPQRIGLSCLGILSKYANRTVSSPVSQNIRTDEALHILFDALGHPSADRDFSSGDTVLEWFWLPDVNPIQAFNEILNAEGAGASFYEDGQGRLIFENRDYRSENTRSLESQYNFSTVETVTEFRFSPDYHDITNQCFIDIVQRAAQALQEIWSLGETLVLGASETKIFTIRTSDPFINAQIPSAVPSDAIQTLQGSATLTSGTFKLKFRDGITASLDWDSTAVEIQAALEALSSMGTGNVVCTGGPINTHPVFVSFVGTLGGQDITDLIEVVESTLNPVSVGATIESSEVVPGDDPLRFETQRLGASGVLVAGTFTISVTYSGGGGTTGNLNFDDTAAEIQTALRLLSGLGATLCYAGPINTNTVTVGFVNVTNENMDEMVIVGSGLMTTAPGATVEVSQQSKGGVPDYVLTGGGLLVSKTVTPTSGQRCELELIAGALGATITGLRLRAQPVTVIRSETVENDSDTSASITKYGPRPFSPSARQEISRETALAVANSFTAYYLNSRPSVDIETVSAFDEMLDQQLYRRISDRIKVTDQKTGVDHTYWIEQIHHTGTVGVLKTVFGCERAVHSDTHSDSHTDTAHSDSSHTDSHTDTAHSDAAHTDSHTDSATHSDVAHSDTHSDTAHSDTAHTDSAHADQHTDSHTDNLHSDNHGDEHTDSAHGDTAHSDTAHSDTAHTDSHTDSHSDLHTDEGGGIDPHSDLHTDTFTDTHSDVAHVDTAHSDTAHSDTAHSDEHSDVAHSDAAHGDSHTDHSHTDTAHGDAAHTDAAHTDSHSDAAHSDNAHSDSHSDVAHSDAAHTDSHTDTAHSDSGHTDSHADSHADEA